VDRAVNAGDAALHRLFDTLERLPWPNPLIGSPEKAEAKLIAAVDSWITMPEPFSASAADLLKVAEAAAEWAYFKRDPYLLVNSNPHRGPSDE
jgi:hypothetical protein